MRHLILGAGPAGVIAAETLRKHAPNDEIVIVGDEAEAPYSRMAIPYLLMGNIGEKGTHLRHDAQHFKKQRIELMKGRAISVDAHQRSVALEDGRRLSFDALLIATGSSPTTPPIPGIHSPGVHPCWTLDDARAIAQRATKGARVVQMGAGFIGCIIMEALAARGVSLSVIEMGDRMVPRMMGPTAGGMIKDWCKAKGVEVHTGVRVDAIEAGTPMKVTLSDGTIIDADLVISATGVKPNIGFLEMQTNVPGIYAAGDCAEALDIVSGKLIVSAIQPNAADQARIAALNMLGRKSALKGVTQINVLDTLGLISASFGDWQGVPGGEHVELTDAAAGRHLSLQFDGDVLVGCNSVGWTEHVGVMRGLVEGQVHLGEWKDKLLADPTQLMPAYLARAQAQDVHALVRVPA
jgi:NADPH-dependent 2,4-dienoyl-CoA reductase/sulfur reductase-like enzyme